MADDNGNDVRIKIKKLLDLTGSPNEHEAALAMERVQTLLEKYSLTMSEIEGVSDEDNSIVDVIFIDGIGRAPKWQSHLWAGISAAFDCTPYYSRSWDGSKKWRIVGHEMDIEAAKATFEYLRRIVDIATDSHLWHLASDPDEIVKGVHPTRARASFGVGFVSTVVQRVKQRRLDRLSQDCKTQALVFNKQAKVDKFVKETVPNLKPGGRERNRSDYDSYHAGRKAGKEVNLDTEVSATGTQRTALK
jgi:hypothetical protein